MLQCTEIKKWNESCWMSKASFANVSSVSSRNHQNAWQGNWEDLVNNRKKDYRTEHFRLFSTVQFKMVPKSQKLRLIFFTLPTTRWPLSQKECLQRNISLRKVGSSSQDVRIIWIFTLHLSRTTNSECFLHPLNSSEWTSLYYIIKRTDFLENCGGRIHQVQFCFVF